MSTPKTNRGGKYKGKTPAPKTPTPQPAKTPGGLIKTTDANGKEHYAEPKYGIRVSHDMVNLLGENGAAAEAKNITDTFELFGMTSEEANAALKRIDADRMRRGAYANYSPAELEINGNPTWFGNPQKMANQYNYDLSQGYHPQGTIPADVLSHEAGHAIGFHLGRELYKIYTHENGKNFGMGAFFLFGGAEKDIISKACSNVKKKTGTNYPKQKRDISGYATTSPQECFAEAVADYRRNGNNAKPLSKEIVKVAKDTFADIRKKKKKYGI